jgi:hypothetical protein
VKIHEKFYHPINLINHHNILITNSNVDSIYSFVLEDYGLININGIECVTLGHGYDDNIAKHVNLFFIFRYYLIIKHIGLFWNSTSCQ